MAKIAICLFLLRIVYQRVHKWILYATMAVSTLWSFCFVFITIFQCSPPSYYWNRNQPGHCLSPDFIINSSIAYGVISMATDFTIGILPIFVVRHLQMNIRSKCAVVGILAMAAVFVLPNLHSCCLITSKANFHLVLAPLPLFDSPTLKITGM